jgi:hypothetical protein
MTVTKIALSALAVIGLTAGTLLAVGEPTAAPLPHPQTAARASCPTKAGAACRVEAVSTCTAAKHTATDDAKSGCSKTACEQAAVAVDTCSNACLSKKCDATVAVSAVKAAAVAARACAADCAVDTVCQTKSNAHCTAAAPGCGTVKAAAVNAKSPKEKNVNNATCSQDAVSLQKKSTPCDEASCKGEVAKPTASKHEAHRAERKKSAPSEATVVIVAECDHCSRSVCKGESCTAKTSTACSPTKKPGSETVSPSKQHKLTIRIGLGKNGPVFHVATGASDACPASKPQKMAQPVATTSCEAKPACASACSVAACAAAHCGETHCETCPAARGVEAGFVTQKSPPAPLCCHAGACACDEECACEACACSTVCPPAPSEQLPTIEAGMRPPIDGGRRLINWTRIGFSTASDRLEVGSLHTHRQGALGGAAAPDDVPGRVRLSEAPMMRFFPPVPDFVPPIILSSFVEPVATMPHSPPHHAAASHRRHPAEGHWRRTVGDCLVEFSCERGRLRGTFELPTPNGETRIHVVGTCSATPDGQLFGVIDEVDVQSPHASLDVRAIAVRFVDQPFAIRFRADGDSLIIKEVRCAGLSPHVEHERTSELFEKVRLIACGRYVLAGE